MAPIIAHEEFAKDKKLKRENIEYLREWMSKQPHLPTGITGKIYMCKNVTYVYSMKPDSTAVHTFSWFQMFVSMV
jgi:hypothetical protein